MAFEFIIISKYLEFLIESITFLLKLYCLRENEKKEEQLRNISCKFIQNY